MAKKRYSPRFKFQVILEDLSGEKNEVESGGVPVLYPKCTCQVYPPRVGYLKLMPAGFRAVENRKATLGTPA